MRCRNIDLCAERRLGQCDWHLDDQIEAVAAEVGMARGADGDEQVAGRAATLRGLPLAAEADRLAVLDPHRDFHRECLGLAAIAAYPQADLASGDSRAERDLNLVLHVGSGLGGLLAAAAARGAA